MKNQSKIFQSPVMNCGKLIDWINLYYLFIYCGNIMKKQVTAIMEKENV